jgi:hypothetical protein
MMRWLLPVSLCLSVLLSISATSTQFFPNAVKKLLFSDMDKSDIFEAMNVFAQEHCLGLTAEKNAEIAKRDLEIAKRDGEIVGLSGRLSGLTAEKVALESEKVALNERLSRGHVDFLRVSRNLCIRGVLELAEARLSQRVVSQSATRTFVWTEILQYYPTCFSGITAYDSSITVSRAAQVIAGVFQNSNTAIHGINAVPIGARAFNSEQQAILKGIMDFLPIQYTEDEDPVIAPLVNMS